MADCLLLLLQGSIITGITCTWTNIIGLWFYAIMLAAIEISIFIKYDNILAPSIMGVEIVYLRLRQRQTQFPHVPIVGSPTVDQG